MFLPQRAKFCSQNKQGDPRKSSVSAASLSTNINLVNEQNVTQMNDDTVVARSKAMILSSIPSRDVDMYVFSVCVLSCVVTDPETDRSSKEGDPAEA
jgi:hypothetical protein